MNPHYRAPLLLLAVFLLMLPGSPGRASSDAASFPSGRAARLGAASAAPSSEQVPRIAQTSVTIPGPLRSFLRMAAISQEASPQNVLPLLARNVVMEGYGWRGKSHQPTEYLILLRGYLKHARELQALAGPEGVIRVSNCNQAQPLLSILGYRVLQACERSASVETAHPKRAFLTIDSGFPLTQLVETLEGLKPFVCPFTSSRVPVLFSPGVWIAYEETNHPKAKGKNNPGPDDLIDALVRDPALARLYWALTRMDAGTSEYLLRTQGLKKLVPLAPALDFYGSEIYLRSGRVAVPGGVRAEPAWKSLVGASPERPAEFIPRLLRKDDGWLVAYYSALARVSGAQQAYFTEPRRLRLFYRALRGRSPLPSAQRPVFRPDPGLPLLVTRLQLDPNGQPHIPGNLEVWKEILSGERKGHAKTLRIWAARARGWKRPDQLIAAMFALSRVNSPRNPLQLYLVLSEIDRGRSPKHRLNPKTVRLMAENFSRYGDQYLIFSEFHALNNSSIARFLRTAQSLDRIRMHTLRADGIGIFQANVGLWQILARQGEIPIRNWNGSFQRVIGPFASIRSSTQLFNAALTSLGEVVRAAGGGRDVSEDEIITLLAGPDQANPEGQQVRQDLAYRILSVMEAQRVVSLDSLFALSGGLNRMAHGKPMPKGMIQWAGELRELHMPKPLFTSGERAEWSYGLYSDSHIQEEMRTNLTKILKSRRPPREIAAARGQLVPFLRDTLVALNYAYYQPPGAEVLYNNPFLVRSHDFLGETIIGGGERAWKTPIVLGRGWTASGGAHLAGSLANLPYVLSEIEQNFIVPQQVQALVWEDLAPTLLTSSIVPRWWRVTPNELHAAALYQEFGGELVKAAAENQDLRQQVIHILSGRLLPGRTDEVNAEIVAGHPQEALSQLTPAEKFYLAAQFTQSFPDEDNRWGKAGQELRELSERYPKEVSWTRLSEDFGVPHPALAQTYACQLLNVKPFPTYLGYSSRLLAESWESNNLYWARLADEKGYPPAILNLIVPELTRRMLANIFATDLEDRPALLRALRETGEEFRRGKFSSFPGIQLASRF
ncbi:MAG: hypothetical protein ACRD3O_02295 [Terriglobia bacterium]